MLTYKEINEFLMSFNTDSYNRSQIGNSKQLIINIYEFLNKLNLNKDTIEALISYIAYLDKSKTNIALYLELLSKSLGHVESYDLSEVTKVVKEIHDIYFKSSYLVPLEEYLHDTNENRIKKLFLNRNNKYLMKNFETDEALAYVADLKLAAAIALDQKEYKEFIGYIDNYEMYQDSYSPILTYKTYNVVRESLKEEKRLFWDILFGNEYLVALTKNNMPIKDIYKKNVFHKKGKKVQVAEAIPVQLDLFSYEDEIAETSPSVTINEDINAIQISTVFNSGELTNFNKEKDLLLFLEKLLQKDDMIILPKLKSKNTSTYMYEVKN